MAINYNPTVWQQGTIFNPTNCNNFEQGIKNACDGVDGLDSEKYMLQIDGFISPTIKGISNYVENGVYHRRIARVDLGLAEWNKSGNHFYAKVPNLNAKRIGDSEWGNGYCSKYAVVSGATVSVESTNGVSFSYSDTYYLGAYDSEYVSADANTFKVSVKGTYLYYELATEQTENIYDNAVVDTVERATVGNGGRNLANSVGQKIHDSIIPCTLVANQTYTFSAKCSNLNGQSECRVNIVVNNTVLNTIGFNSTTERKSVQITPSNNATEIKLVFWAGGQYIDEIMVEQGTVAHPYEPYYLSNRQLTAQYGRLSLAYDFEPYSDGSFICKIGNMVFLSLSITTTTNMPSGKWAAQVPNGYWPKSLTILIGATTESARRNIQANVSNTNGEINLYTANDVTLPSNANIMIQGFWTV